MSQNNEEQQKSLLPALQTDDEYREINALVQRATNIRQSMTGDIIQNHENAISLYQQALSQVDPESGYAAEIRHLKAEAMTEQLKLIAQQASTTNALANQTRQTLKTLVGKLENLEGLEKQNTQDVSKLAKRDKKVRALLVIEDAVTMSFERGVTFLAQMFKPLLVAAGIAIIIALLAPTIFHIYFNNSAIQLCSSGNIVISASSVMQPLLQAEAQKYQERCLGATIKVITTSPDGIPQVDANPTIAIGSAETLAYTTQHQLWDAQIAATIFTLIMNKQTGVSNLTTENIRDIYSGKVANWNQVCSFDKKRCGNNLGINIIGRPANSDVRAVFEQYVLGSSEYIEGSLISDVDTLPQGNGIIQDVVNTPGAISYVALNTAQKAHLSLVSIDGVAPSPSSISNQAYKFWGIEHLYTQGPATGLAQKFIYFMRTDDAISLLHSYGFQSIVDIPENVLKDHLAGSA